MTYKTTGRVDRHGIEADFGEFGRVDLRFAGSPERSLRSPRTARRGSPVRQEGAMRGRVEFESLGGLIQLEADRVEGGQTWHAPRRTCTTKPSEFPPAGRTSSRGRAAGSESRCKTFVARAHLLARTIDLFAVRFERRVIDVSATSTRRFGPVLVSTSVHALEEHRGARRALGSDPRPRYRPPGATLRASARSRAARRIVGGPACRRLARVAGGGDAQRRNAAVGRVRLRCGPLRLCVEQA